MRDILIDQADGALLLPDIRAIGDIDDVELAADAAEPAWPGEAGDLVLPPGIGELDRLARLARLVHAWAERIGGSPLLPRTEIPLHVPVNPSDSVTLARHLAALIDDFGTESVPFDRLKGLAAEDYADYWAITVQFLEIAAEWWPAELEELGLADAADRRSRLIRAEAARLAAKADGRPVIAAGSTGSIPATGELLSAIARLPRGAVVLPGLDTGLDQSAWDTIGGAADSHPGHPQYGLKKLLARMKTDRAGVEVLGASANGPREALASEMMLPVAATGAWRNIGERLDEDRFAKAMAGVSVVEAAGDQEEALAIALSLRETLLTPGKTAALVTPDRSLARCVDAELARWNIAIGDSAGIPLAETGPGRFFRMIAETVVSGLDPARVTSLIRHPLFDTGKSAAHALEVAVLRGPSPGRGSEGLRQAARTRLEGKATGRQRPGTGILDDKAKADALLLADRLADGFAAIETLGAWAEFADWLSAHATLAASLSRTEDDAPALFVGEAGVGLARFVHELAAAAPALGPVGRQEYPALLSAMMTGSTQRPRRPGHPRLHILGPLEARLLSFDRVIIGGANEGVWPGEARTDPWLNRPMRAELGLEPPERFVGLAAHDFTQLFCAPEVIVTRALKSGGSPSVASRWLQRLQAVTGAKRWQEMLDQGARWTNWARRLDLAKESNFPAEPLPCPPVNLRPAKISVTEAETLIRDPYAVYARRVLGLEPLPALDEEPDAALRGTIVHDILNDFAEAEAGGDALSDLIAIGQRHFSALDDFPEVRAFWWPRFRRIADWVVENGIVSMEGIAVRRTEVFRRGEVQDRRPRLPASRASRPHRP